MAKQDDKPDQSQRDTVDRAAKVEALRRSIAEGTYNISSGKVADKLIQDMLRKS